MLLRDKVSNLDVRQMFVWSLAIGEYLVNQDPKTPDIALQRVTTHLDRFPGHPSYRQESVARFQVVIRVAVYLGTGEGDFNLKAKKFWSFLKF